jgi:hypothetical protein
MKIVEIVLLGNAFENVKKKMFIVVVSLGSIKLTSKIDVRKFDGKSTRALRIYLILLYYVFSRHFLLN